MILSATSFEKSTVFIIYKNYHSTVRYIKEFRNSGDENEDALL